MSHHRHHHISKSSTLPKPLKGILKNKADQQLIIPHLPNSQLFPEENMSVLNDNFYTRLHEMAFNNQQQMLPLNVMNYNHLEQTPQIQPNVTSHTLPRHLDVVPFDTLPPCDDCLKEARYKGSYSTVCHGTSGAECSIMNSQAISSQFIRRMSNEERTLHSVGVNIAPNIVQSHQPRGKIISLLSISSSKLNITT